MITRLAQFLARTGIDAITEIDRPVLERYLADLHTEMAGNQRQGSHLGLLSGFFAAIRQHRWDTNLPASAMFFTEDYPKRAERLPRAPDAIRDTTTRFVAVREVATQEG